MGGLAAGPARRGPDRAPGPVAPVYPGPVPVEPPGPEEEKLGIRGSSKGLTKKEDNVLQKIFPWPSTESLRLFLPITTFYKIDIGRDTLLLLRLFHDPTNESA